MNSQSSPVRFHQFLIILSLFITSCIILTVIYFSMTSHMIYVYYCYALAFLKGAPFTLNITPYCATFLPSRQAMSGTFPPDYPIFSLFLFTLPLLFPLPYEYVFIALMLFVFLFLTVFFVKTRSFLPAVSFIFLSTVTGATTLIARYDLLVGSCILLAVHTYETTHFKKAYLLLALGTMLKFIPILCILPFVLNSSKKLPHFFTWKNIVPPFIFLCICILAFSFSALVSFQATISPFIYFVHRPFELESTPALFLFFLLPFLSHLSLCTTYSFGSVNLLPSFTTCAHPDYFLVQEIGVSFFAVECCLIGLFLLLLIKKRIEVSTTVICIILSLFLTGKVFSPQYLMWVTPLIAYTFGTNRSIILLWGSIGLLTTYLYLSLEKEFSSFLPIASPDSFFFLSSIRVLLLIISIIYIIYHGSHRLTKDKSLN